jgi:predicted phage terminase large subunit-like protein
MTGKHQDVYPLLRAKLHPFIRKSVETLLPADKFLDNWHIEAMAHLLEQCEQGEVKRAIITVPPRHLKSISVSVAFTAWLLGRNPSARIMSICYSDTLAFQFSRSTRDIIRAPWYKKTFPGTRINSKKDAEGEFETTNKGRRIAASIRGSLTGRGAQYIIIDDPIKLGEAQSEAERNFVIEAYRSSILNRLDNPNNGVIILVMQRAHYEDLAGYLLDQGGWYHLNLPAIAEEQQVVPLGNNKEYPREIDEVLHPAHMSRETLDDYRDASTSHHFETHFQQNPAPPGGSIFKREWFHRYPTTLDKGKCTEIILSWDTAVETGVKNAFSVCTIWGLIEGRAYLLNVYRERLDYPSLKNMILRLARAHGATRVLIEKASSGRSLLQDLRNAPGLNLMAFPVMTDKIERASRATAAMEAGRIFFPEDAPWLAPYERELLSFPNSSYSDQVDSTSQFLIWHNDFLQRKSHKPRTFVLGNDSRGGDSFYARTGNSGKPPGF